MRTHLTFLLFLSACTPSFVDKDSGSDPLDARLVFSGLSGGTVVAGESVELGLALVDAAGTILPLELSVQISVDGTAAFMVDLIEGEAAFPMTFSGCALRMLEADSLEPGLVAPASALLSVTPTVTLESHPRVAEETGPLPDIEVSLSDPEGLEGSSLDLVGDGLLGATSTAVSGGVLRFSGLFTEAEGLLEIAIRGHGECFLDQPLWSLLVADEVTVLPAFLPEARVGELFEQALDELPELTGDLPPGIEELGGTLSGIPVEPGNSRIEVARWTESGAELLSARFTALPERDEEIESPTLDPSLPGAWPIDAIELTLPELTVSHGTYRDVRVRVAFPSDGEGGVAEGLFPLLSFHHAAHYPADIYDYYTDLHGHWASHGLIVASVDSSVNVSGQSQSWQNLVDMSTFQLAAGRELIALADDPSSPFFGHVDPERVFVSGHSRGGGASLISLWRDPTLLGAVLFEPVSPLQTPEQDWTDPESNADRPFPAKPILLFNAGLDLDEPWPLPDISYEQTTGPALLVTIHGANHEDSMDEGTPGGLSSVSTISRAERHDVDQHYSTAFFLRFGGMGEAAGELAYDPALFLAPAFDTDLSSAGVSVTGQRFMASELLIDDFQGEPEHNALGGVNLSEGLMEDDNDEPYAEGLESVGRYDTCGEQVGLWARARYLSWSAPEARLELGLGKAVDLSGDDALIFRIQRDCPPPFGGWCPDQEVDVEVRLVDALGAEASVPASLGMGDLGIVGRFWSTCRLDLDEFLGVDLSQVLAVRIDPAGMGWDEGGLWLDDLRVE